MNPDPDPLPPRVGCEHPAFTAVFDKLLSEVPPIQAPPLEMARRKLLKLEQEWATQEAKDYAEGVPIRTHNFSEEWHRLQAEVEATEAEVRRLESEALK